MATATLSPRTAQIGETAGRIWCLLHDSGPLSIAQVVKTVDAPRDTVMQAIGWLAREDKLDIEDAGRRRILSLR